MKYEIMSLINRNRGTFIKFTRIKALLLQVIRMISVKLKSPRSSRRQRSNRIRTQFCTGVGGEEEGREK
jgi:hypothetical protein